MNKIANYLNEHILGEVIAHRSVRQQMSHDGSPLSLTPEMIAQPRNTDDIRKIARFAWQLSEKGHILPIITRGAGSDYTGAAIGRGIIIDTATYLNKVLFINLRKHDQFVHLQPGCNALTANEALRSHGMTIPSLPSSAAFSTIGGAVANNAAGPLSGRYGQTSDWVQRLEVILANGDLIETRRLSKHELGKMKGLQTFEGEIYRKIDGLIEDNHELICEQIANKPLDNSGYSGISKVKEKDGSFDLTPLMTGSQGTLGIISEIIMRIDYCNETVDTAIAVFDDLTVALDTVSKISDLQPATLELIDGRIYKQIKDNFNKKFIISSDDIAQKTIVIASFDDYSDGTRRHKVKKAVKIFSRAQAKVYSESDYQAEDIQIVKDCLNLATKSYDDNQSYPSIIDSSAVPASRRQELLVSIEKLASKHLIDLTYRIDCLSDTVCIQPPFQLHQVSDKQKLFRLMTDYAELIASLGGSQITKSAEGRLKAPAVYAVADERVIKLYEEIKSIFDPHGILNPGIKRKDELRTIISSLDSDYNLDRFLPYL